VCEKTHNPNGETCHKCKSKNQLDGLLVCVNYHKNKSIKKAVSLFKYRFVSDLCVPLGKIIEKKLIRSSLNLPDIIIPVPLHPKRLRWRGFNQSEMLANFISKNLTPGIEIPVTTTTLYRKKNTPPQKNISNYHERKSNLKQAFSLSRNRREIKGINILLIDDIATTGTTIFECAKVLKKGGAKKVFAIVIARPHLTPDHEEHR
jgi:ComF family protein